jgi:DNA-binding transcriptional ArsR family regulator
MPRDNPASGGPPPQLREITDVQTMRALAHPVRIALLETLGLAGPMTATQAGERINESPTTCSFHLRQLAKYGFVEEAGRGKGRARPWRLTSTAALQITSGDDSESELAADAFVRLFRERVFGRYRAWLEGRGLYPRKWRAAAGESHSVLYVTAEELQAFNDEMVQLLGSRYRERIADPATRPPGAIAVELLVLSYPIEPPPAEENL